MANTVIPPGYRSALNLYDTQTAIGAIKLDFQDRLANALNLKRVSAPLFVDPATGLNDDLNGTERAVAFDITETGQVAQVVHSLAKWKRMALYLYDFYPGNGLYTDMNAIRRDEEMDNLHSIYVDQWDWEKVLPEDGRNRETLHQTVRAIVGALMDTGDAMREKYHLPDYGYTRDVYFVTTQELEDRWPQYTSKQREDAICKEHHTVFLEQIGGALKSGHRHDGRAPDYDDWALNGDILLWSPVLGRSVELSSMGVRVDPAALDAQLRISGCENRKTLPFHRLLLAGKLPPAIGGGIGQSRLCLLLLGKAHIGEVQCSLWDDATRAACEAAGVVLL